jgi:nucleoid-associated protein YgaU
MVINPFKAFLFIASGATAAVATAYVSGALEPYLHNKEMAAVATSPEPKSSAQPAAPTTAGKPKEGRLPQQPAPAAAGKAPEAASKAAPPDPAPAKETAGLAVIPPSFDLLRAESNGSIVVAGKAAPKATVEIVAGAQVLGTTKAGADGDFAIVLDDPLKPGGHELVLRSTTDDKVVATSPETAVVSIPEQKEGQVLALVEKPGEPSKLITVPEPKPAGPKPAPQEGKPAPQAGKPAAKTGAPAEAKGPAAPEQPEVAQNETSSADSEKAPPAKTLEQPETEPPAAGQDAAASQPAEADSEPKVAVDAVEIEGRKVFVAGGTDPGRQVRVYANDILLGEALASPDGRFLVETERDLPVGDYIIRADALEPGAGKVVARAAVPFEREPGEAVAAVAPKPQPIEGAPAAASGPGPASPTAPEEAKAPPEDAPAPAAIAAAQPAAPSTAENSAAPPAAAQPEGQATASPPSEGAAPAPGQKLAAGEPAPKLQSVDGAVIIRRGDTLWRISRRVYGRGVRYSTIYLANQDQIRDPDRIWPGQVFNVPGKTPEGDAADMTAVKGQTAPAAPKAPL